ncbi:MAG: chorismate-binding protein, partial [Actinoplanes sp.]
MEPFALLHRDGAGTVDVLTGDVITVGALADIPLPAGPGPRTLALVPYRQITERGFACVDDEAPLECLRIATHTTTPLGALIDALPDHPVETRDGRFDLSDDAYGDIVEQVLREEIGHGEGANFVIHRVFTATVDGDPLDAARAAFRHLLTREQGAYWTFLVHTGTRTLVGASPERHVSVLDGLTMMNPISGTFRHGSGDPVEAARAAFGRLLAHEQGTYWTFLVHTGTRTLVGATPERHVSVADGLTMMNPISGTFRHDGTRELVDFLSDRKEIDELYMVLDEELKMMAAVAEHGGQVVGPYLKRMAHLTHTEYLLAGRGSLDVRDVLRATMFAPTVTGSPVENACRVIARHERRGRGYYAGVLALLGHDDDG